GQSKPKPVKVSEHYGLSDFDFSGLRQDGPKTFTTSHPGTPLQGFAPWSSTNQARPQYFPPLLILQPLCHNKDFPCGLLPIRMKCLEPYGDVTYQGQPDYHNQYPTHPSQMNEQYDSQQYGT
ncbi:hypothetical protein Tco_0866574, partial [Tanacetum coccineum]